MPRPRASLIYASILAIFALLAGCKETAPEAPASQPQPTPTATPRSLTGVPASVLAEFKRLHGSDYDAASKTDREKLAVLLETASPAPSKAVGDTRERIILEAGKLVGLRETHGANRSPLIDQMNRLTGAPMGSPWCASFNAWVYKLAGVSGKWPRSAWSPDWVRDPTWTRAKGGRTPLPGDAFGIWFSNKGRVAHTGLIEKWGDSVLTIEGNTGPSGSIGEADRNGDGSYRKRRLKAQIYSVRDWIAAK